MATAPQSSQHDQDSSRVLPEDHRLPGWTVDALLAEGKVDEARAELERLLEEALDSGDPVEMAQTDWDELRSSLHREARLGA